MYLQKIKNSINGYVRFRAEGFFIEKFINTCKNSGYYLENLNREKNTIISADIPAKDYRFVCKIAKKDKCNIRILKKKGIPFIINRYRKRKIFVIALLMIIVSITILSKFIWNIEVIGNSRISKDEIIEIIKNDGLSVGKLKSKINISDITEDIRLQRSDVAWVGIRISGTNAIIEIVEADEKPEVIDSKDYCNIVANKDAIIVEANAQNGTLQVKEGDVVEKGTVLIAGWMEGKYTGVRYVHATGEVKAKVWYSAKKKIQYKNTLKRKTGNTEKKYSLNINNFAINLYKKLSKFEIYDTIGTEKKLRISSNFYLPFKIVVKENYELIEEDVVYSVEEAKEIGVNELTEELNRQVECEEDIINKYISTKENEDYIEVEVIYEVLESIGTEEKIAV